MTKKDESKAVGGKARAAALSPSRRTSIAKAAAAARWAGPLKATHKGNFQQDFGIDVECYVLDNEMKTAVISQRGMGASIGLTSSGQAFTRFAAGKTIAPYLGAEIQAKISKPLKFQWIQRGAEQQPSGEINGYDVTLLIDVCQAIITAESEGKLLSSQKNIAKQAHIILGASAKAGIQGLVYALAGYDRTKDEVIAAYKMYVMEEAREYEREFSPELYEQWYRLYGLTKPERGRPWEFKYLTIDHIYKPLAKSAGKVFSMAKSSKQANGEKGDKIHMFLSEIGVKALRTQIGKIIGIATVSEDRSQYERFIADKVFGQASLDLKP